MSPERRSEPGAAPPHAAASPSAWVVRFAAQIRPGGSVLDLAAGYGRHARWLANAGLTVEAVDRDPQALAALGAIAGVETRQADLEAGAWPYEARRFDAIVVANYLWRPLLPRIALALAPGALLIYETFSVGNEIHGKPSNPQFLLQGGELLEFAHGAELEVIAFESGYTARPRPAIVQRICARRSGGEGGAVVLDADLRVSELHR